MGLFSVVLDLLFPPKCVFCGGLIGKKSEGLCRACAEKLPYLRGAAARATGDYFTVCVSPLKYDGHVRRSILRYKFGGASHYAEVYGRMLANCIREHLSGQYDLITWVPLSKRRRHDRGYDQAMLLAMATALCLSDVAVETLVKARHVQAQSSLGGREARRANVSGVFEVTDPDLIADKRILLIDDIITTGATLSECARTLLMAGAESVACATLARSD
ncbi:MAG: ComF family protein [Clostridiales bacterium]|nr:ComF family protein [Clostridiales bacterium]